MSGSTSRTAFAFGLPSDIFAFYRSTRNSILVFWPQVLRDLCNTYSFLKYFHCLLLGPPTNPLRPIIPDNACPFRITAAAGTKFAGTSSTNSFIILFVERSLWTICPLPPRQIAGSGFRPLSNIPYCCLLSKFRPSLIPDVAIPPLRVAWGLRLGAPLPHQLPDPA